MPKVTEHDKFEISPDYDETAHLAREIAAIRTYLEKELACVDAIENTTMQAICMFAMIDCLAQENANYIGKPHDVFCNFVLKHQKQCDYLESVEPVTLYYHVEDLIEESEPLPGFPPEKVISLEDFGYLYDVQAESILSRGKSQEILDYIEKKKGRKFAEDKAREHKLINLLYRMRSKAVHEMSGLGESWKNKHGFQPDVPYYREVSRGYVLDGNWVYDDVIELVFPNSFIRNVLVDCINGYLADCESTKHFPFSNNDITRKLNLTWYDK